MKKILSGFCIVLSAGLLALSSCNKVETPAPEADVQLVFDIQVEYGDDPQTRAVKTDWEDGDKIFVFFTKPNGKYLDPAKYVTITYNGSSWDTSVDSGSSNTLDFYTFGLPGSGTMYAIYFPFGGVRPESGKFISRGHTNRCPCSRGRCG